MGVTLPLHNYYRVRWQNYRPFRDTGWLELKPLTLIIGPNNAGKSSLLSPFLLLNQTVTTRDSETPLVTRGSLVDAGTFTDILYRHDKNRHLKLAVEFHSHDETPATKPLGAYPPGGFEVTFRAGELLNEILLERYRITDVYRRNYLAVSRDINGHYRTRGISTSSMKSRERRVVRAQSPTNFWFSPSSALYSTSVREADNFEWDPTNFSKAFSSYVAVAGYAEGEILNIFNNLSYIGPLRERSKRYYEYSGEIPSTVGLSGQNTASILRRRLPELKERVDFWIKRFEFGDELVLDGDHTDVFSIGFRAGGYTTNMADSGFGASQLLPLIVQSLVAPPGSLTIAEQPEIHLNPKIQSAMAELLAEMVNDDHRIIVETHSEHLLMAIRRLIAEGTLSHELVSVLFVEQGDVGSTIRSIDVSDNGGIQQKDWPKGFFDDALRESVALARAQIERSKRARGLSGGHERVDARE